MNDQERIELIQRTRARWGPDLIETLISFSAGIPDPWRGWPADRGFEYLRCRLKFTQDELRQKSGLSQSQISRLEGGGDALLSTWRKLYRTMGFELMLVPVSSLSVAELVERSEEGRPEGFWRRQRARPRRLR
jgi:hypothetical protein